MTNKDKNQLQKQELKRWALDLYNDGMPQVRIAHEIGISDSTLRRWLREMKIPPKKHRHEENKVTEEDPDPVQKKLTGELANTLNDSLKLEKGRQRKEEDIEIINHAEMQTSPAEKYQSYMSASAIKLLRDSLKIIRPAKTIRELDQLDQMIRRNLGLDSRGSAVGKVSIDVSILTNNKTALAGKRPDTKIIEAEVSDTNSEEEEKG